MKKLMIAAAAAAMIGGASAAPVAAGSVCKGCEGWVVVNPSIIVPEIMEVATIPGHVWDITIKASTLVKKGMKCPSDCAVCGVDNSACYYENGKRTINGVAWTCYEPCTTADYDGDAVQENNDNGAAPQMLFWDAKTKVSFGYVKIDYLTKVVDGVTYYSGVPTIENVTLTQSAYLGDDNNVPAGEAFRYGKKADKAAWGFDYEGTSWKTSDSGNTAFLKTAGVALGTIKIYKGNEKAGIMDNIVINKATGAAIGKISSCLCDEYAVVLPVCYEDFTSWCEDFGDELAEVPFYGTLTVKYNESKSKKLRTTPLYLITPGAIFPKYCFWDEQ